MYFLLSLALILIISACNGGGGSGENRLTIEITSYSDGETVIGSRFIAIAGRVQNADSISSVTIDHNGNEFPGFSLSSGSFGSTVTLDNRNNSITVTVTADSQTASDSVNLNYPFISLENFQNASVVIGQSDFTEGSLNRGESVAINTLFWPVGKVSHYNGDFYLPDFGNNRILGFNSIPTSNNANADFVLGQPDFTSSTPGDNEDQMSLPAHTVIYDGKLFVLEVNNHRLLIWNTVPTSTGVPADVVVGQASFGASTNACTRTNLNAPHGLYVVDGKIIIGDVLNNRVLIWNSIPTINGAPADIVLGQPDFTTCIEGTSALELDGPSDVWSNGDRLVVSDTHNNRILIWNSFPTLVQNSADIVIGQPNMETNTSGVSERNLESPYGIFSNGNQLFVTDILNHRILVWDGIPWVNYKAADRVIGQSNFTNNTPNDDDQDGVTDLSPSARTVAYPSGIFNLEDRLFVADQLNSRILIFEDP